MLKTVSGAPQLMAIGLEYSFADTKYESEGRKFCDFRVWSIFANDLQMIKADVLAYENTYINHHFASATGFCMTFVASKRRCQLSGLMDGSASNAYFQCCSCVSRTSEASSVDPGSTSPRRQPG